MSIFDIFRSKKEQKTSKKVKLSELDRLTKEEKENLDERSEKFRNELKNLVSQFSLGIRERIPELKQINLENRREKEQLKEIVTSNLSLYISLLEKLIEDMEEINNRESKDVKNYIQEIQQIFNRFSKESRMIYERATILIGKELGKIKEIIREFTKVFNSTIELNKGIFEKEKLIEELKGDLDELNDFKNLQVEMDNSIKTIGEQISRFDKEKQSYERGYKNYKENKEYKLFIEEQEKIKQEDKLLDEDILKLKQGIDFKSLLRYFHNDQKKNKIIKDYSEKFKDSLKEDNDLIIINLINQTETNKTIDLEKIKKIKQRISEQKIFGEDEQLKEIEDNIKKLEQEIMYKKEEVEHEKEKKIRFEKKEEGILLKVKEETSKIWDNIIIES